MVDKRKSENTPPETRPAPHEMPARERPGMKLLFGSFGVFIIGATIVAVGACVVILIALS